MKNVVFSTLSQGWGLGARPPGYLEKRWDSVSSSAWSFGFTVAGVEFRCRGFGKEVGSRVSTRRHKAKLQPEDTFRLIVKISVKREVYTSTS